MENTKKMSLEEEVKVMIIDRLGLDVDPKEIDPDAPIFKSYDMEETGLGLDSIDALELVVGLNENFGVKVADDNMNIFKSINTISDFIREQKGEEK